MSDHDEQEPVGSVGQEAAKLLQALQEWAKESGSEHADAAASAAAGAADTMRTINEHIATGGQDCRYCPICQVISAVRDTSPEVKQHLSTAASSFMQAVAGLMAANAPDADKKRPDSPVEKIDLSDDPDWDAD